MVGFAKFEQYGLLKAAKFFAIDENAEVRRIFAASLPDVIQLVNQAHLGVFKDITIRLTHDQQWLVLTELCQRLPDILKRLDKGDPESVRGSTTPRLTDGQKKGLAEIIQVMMDREKELEADRGINWRALETLISPFACFPDHFDSETPFNTCVQGLLGILLNVSSYKESSAKNDEEHTSSRSTTYHRNPVGVSP